VGDGATEDHSVPMTRVRADSPPPPPAGAATPVGRAPAAAGMPPWVKVLMAGQVASLSGFALFLLRPVPGWHTVRDIVLGNLVLLLPGLLCLARIRSPRANRQLRAQREAGDTRQNKAGQPQDALRKGYGLLGAGCLAFTAGNLLYVLWVAGLDPLPTPSWADVGYLSAYPLLAVGLALLACAELGQRLPGGLWLDGLTGLLGTATVGSVLGLRVILEQLSGSPAALAVTAAYPLWDLLLISMVVGVFALRGGRPGRAWCWVGSGLLVFAVGDTLYLWRVAAGTYTVGTPLDLTWALGLNLLAAGVWCRRPATAPATSSGAAALVLPVGASLAALAVLIGGHWLTIPWYSVAMAGATLLAALLRTVAAFRAAHLLAESRAQARTDDLTGLSNRRGFYEYAQQAVDGADAAGPVGLLLLDLDRFKEINDTLGHHVGDDLLRQIAARLSGGLRPGDHLARLGGDEFVIVLPGAPTTLATDVAARVTIELNRPFVLDGVHLQVSASIGVAVHPDHAEDVSGLLQRADVAMYQAKQTRSGTCVYDAARDEQNRDRLSTIDHLRGALDADELVLHYQPQVDVLTGAVLGVEALVRWRHPDRGLVYPDEFLPLVEQTGLMPALTLHVLDRAVAQCAQWRLDGLELTVSVNLSVSNLLDEQLPSHIATVLTRHGVPASALLLEVTENTLMVDPDQATRTMTALHELGIALSIDDYGTGYCSLAYLRDLPVDELKLDKSFLRDTAPGSRASAIVRSTIDLAHALGLRMVAEGVEDAAGLHLLLANHCDVAQGYHFTHPLPADALTAWLREQPAPGRTATAPTTTSDIFD